jgi:hypothetical protein
MFELRLPPEYEVTVYQTYERELLRDCELRRLANLSQIRHPSIADQLLLVTGNTLVALGERLRARSMTTELAV